MGLIRTIRDYFGRAIEQQPDPVAMRSRHVVHGIRDRESLGSILSDVTPARIVQVFREADEGYIGRQVELAQDIRDRDDHVGSVDQTRRLAVQGMDFLIEPGDNSAEAKQAADAFRAEWEAMQPGTIIGLMMNAVLEQWSVQRIVWETDGKLNGRKHWRPSAILEEDARRMYWPSAGERTDIPLLSSDWSFNDGVELRAGEYLLHNYRAVRGRPGKGSLTRAVAWLWMFKRFSFADLAALIEQWGRPWPSLNYDPKASPEEVQRWIEALADSMADRVIAVPNGANLQVTDAKASGAETPHIKLIEICDRAFSKIIIGSTTVAEAAANNDSVSSPTHAKVREDIRNADAHACAATIYRSLIVPWTLWNYGPNVAPPKYGPNTESTPEPAQRSQIYITARDTSLPVKSAQVYGDLGLERPEGVPDVLTLKNPAGGMLGSDSLLPVSTSVVDPGTDPAPATEQDVKVTQDAVLNGAQIQAAISIVKSVTLREIPRDAGIGQLKVLFNLSDEQAESIMGSAGTDAFTPAVTPGTAAAAGNV